MAGGVFAFAGVPFALLHAKRPNMEHGLTAMLSFVCAATTLGLALFASTVPADGVLPERLGLLLAFALVARLALRDTLGCKTQGGTRARVIYALAASFAALEVSGALHPRASAFLSYGGGALAAILLTVSLAGAYLDGRREVGGALFGAGVLLVTIVYDGLLEASATRFLHLVPFGLLMLVTGFMAKLALEHVEVRQRLDARRRELRSRTRELMHSNDELRATQAALSTKEQLAAVGELAAVVAHEVRNPLAILGNAVASLRKETLAPDDRATLLEIIDSEATRLNRIVTDLLSFSRPITLQRGAVQLCDLVDRALTLAAKKPEVRVDLQVQAGDARVWADSNLLRQVLDNLIENAMQAMETGGTLTVRVRRADAGVVTVEVIDTGEGMDTAVRARAKDPFFTTRPSGTGLGLAIVDRIVGAHGGRIEIDSRAGEGTKVSVELPAASAEPPSSRPPSEPPAAGPGYESSRPASSAQAGGAVSPKAGASASSPQAGASVSSPQAGTSVSSPPAGTSGDAERLKGTLN
jgi:signal transduction histidine kinase